MNPVDVVELGVRIIGWVGVVLYVMAYYRVSAFRLSSVPASRRSAWCAGLACLGLSFAVAEELPAQASPRDAPRRLDVEVAYLTGSWLWPISATWSLGPELGLGLLEQMTLAPADDDFTGIVHIGATSTVKLSPRASLDIGLRLGVGELRSRSCSGCIPGGYGSGTLALFLGNGRFQGGTRVLFGRASGRKFGAWSPLVGRLRF